MSNQEQPVEVGHNDANTGAKLSGLIDQMREDLKQGHVDDLETVLRERLNDIGVDVRPEEFAKLLAEIKP